MYNCNKYSKYVEVKCLPYIDSSVFKSRVYCSSNIIRTRVQVTWNETKRLWILEEYVYFPIAYKYACDPNVFRGAENRWHFFFIRPDAVPLIESALAVAVSAARVHSDRIVSRRRRRGGIRQQRQSASEQRSSQRNRSEQGPKRGHSRGTEGNGHPEIQVRFYAADLFHPSSSFPSLIIELFTSYFPNYWK